MAAQAYMGATIALTSKSDIRYVGVLVVINQQDATVALEHVRSFGTEGRRPNDEIPPSDTVYEYIVFRGADIKDLQVVDGPPHSIQPIVHRPAINDPAILNSTGPRPGYPQMGAPYMHAGNPYMMQHQGAYPQYQNQPGYWQQPHQNHQNHDLPPPSPQEHQQPPHQQQQQHPTPHQNKAVPKPATPAAQKQTPAPAPTLTKSVAPSKPSTVDEAVAKLSNLSVSDRKAPLPAPTNRRVPPHPSASALAPVAPVTASPAHAPSADMTQSNGRPTLALVEAANKENAERVTRQYQREPSTGHDGRRGSSSGNNGYRGRGNRGRGRGGADTFAPRMKIPDEDYDFESANAKFRKDDVAKQVDQSPTHTVDGGEDSASESDGFYDKTSSFFDNISCEAKDRSEAALGFDRRARHIEDRRLNLETFGQVHASPRYNPNYRGRGRGGSRGGYRGNNNSNREAGQEGGGGGYYQNNQSQRGYHRGRGYSTGTGSFAPNDERR